MSDRELLEELRREIARDSGVPIFWGDDRELELEKLPLGIASVDVALDGGFAFGRFSEVIGEPSAGKTVLTYLAMRAAQTRGLPCVYIDVERSWEPRWAAAVGVDVTGVLVAEPRTGEKAFDVAIALVKTKPCGVLVLDSIAAMTAEAEIADDVSMGQQFVGLQARLVNRGVRTIVTENAGWVVLAINQLRSSVGVTYGNPEVRPGGKGQGFYAWQVVRVRRGAWIEEGKGPGRTSRVGYQLRVQVEKNKQGSPFKEAEVPFYFTGQIDELAGLVDVAVQLGLCGEGRGGRYEWDGQRIHGRRGLTEFFRESAMARAALEAAVAEVEPIDA